MGARRGTVDAHLPDYPAHGIRFGLHVGENAIPCAVASPAIEPIRAGLPRAVALREIAPRRAGAQFPQDAIDDHPMVTPLAPALLIHDVENARSLGLPQAQIFVASRRQALQMTEHPLPNARFAAVAFPDNGDGRHGAKSP